MKPHHGYQHDALLYRDAGEFLERTVPFVQDGVRQGQPVLVALIAERVELLRDALGPDADGVDFIDMARLGANPARIIPRWRRFLDERCDDGSGAPAQPVRGIGEPIWAGRRPAELVECQLHESLLNVAVEPDVPFWLACPYNAVELGDDVLDEAARSHPTIVDGETYRGSTGYGGLYHVEESFRTELPEPADPPEPLGFGPGDVAAVCAKVGEAAAAAGLRGDRLRPLVAAAGELAADSARRGRGTGVLRLWTDDDALICELSDRGTVADPMVGRLVPDDPDDAEGRAVWLAHQVCDLVQVRSHDHGTAIRIHSWR